MGLKIVGELAQIIIDTAEVVINHVEDDAHSHRMGLIDESTEIVRLAIQPCWGENFCP
jgi:hypothetical protein